jgi:hypothetical protein
VSGLCGSFNPDQHFADDFTREDGSVLDLQGQPQLWGGPSHGKYQEDFVESFAVVGGGKLFSDAECSDGGGTDGTSGEGTHPTEPFAGCPYLKDNALALCPAGNHYHGCVLDVGLTCDLVTWITDAKDDSPGNYAGAGAGIVVSLANHQN